MWVNLGINLKEFLLNFSEFLEKFSTNLGIFWVKFVKIEEKSEKNLKKI